MKREYVASRYIRTIKIDHGNELIYHTLNGNPILIDRGIKTILKEFIYPQSIDVFLNNYKLDVKSGEALNQLIVDGFLVYPENDNREYIFEQKEKKYSDAIRGKELHVLDLSVSELCNFGCHYCVHSRATKLDKSRAGETGLMSKETAQTAIDAFLSHIERNNIKEWDLHFGSAEALLNFEIMKWVVEYLKKTRWLPQNISVNSNLSLLTREMAEYFRDNSFRVNTSIDGKSGINDLIRIFKDGRKTSREIIRGIDLIREIGHHINGVGITLCDENYENVNADIIKWLKGYDVQNVLIDIDFVNMVEFDPQKAANKMVCFEKRCRQEGILAEGLWKVPYKNIMDSSTTGHSRFCASLSGNNLLVTPSGNLYICSYSATPIGHINDFPHCLTNGSFEKIISNSLKANYPECKDCEIEGHCLGGCLLTREGGQAQNHKISQMCSFYKATTIKLLIWHAKEVMRNEAYEN